MAVWLQNVSGSYFSVYAAAFSSGSWGMATLLDNGTSDASEPQVAIDGSGNAMAVWLQAAGNDSNFGIVNGVYYNRFTSGAWGTAKLIGTLPGESLSPQIAMDNNGDTILVWIQHWEPPGVGRTNTVPTPTVSRRELGERPISWEHLAGLIFSMTSR